MHHPELDQLLPQTPTPPHYSSWSRSLSEGQNRAKPLENEAQYKTSCWSDGCKWGARIWSELQERHSRMPLAGRYNPRPCPSGFFPYWKILCFTFKKMKLSNPNPISWTGCCSADIYSPHWLGTFHQEYLNSSAYLSKLYGQNLMVWTPCSGCLSDKDCRLGTQNHRPI